MLWDRGIEYLQILLSCLLIRHVLNVARIGYERIFQGNFERVKQVLCTGCIT